MKKDRFSTEVMTQQELDFRQNNPEAAMMLDFVLTLVMCYFKNASSALEVFCSGQLAQGLTAVLETTIPHILIPIKKIDAWMDLLIGESGIGLLGGMKIRHCDPPEEHDPLSRYYRFEITDPNILNIGYPLTDEKLRQLNQYRMITYPMDINDYFPGENFYTRLIQYTPKDLSEYMEKMDMIIRKHTILSPASDVAEVLTEEANRLYKATGQQFRTPDGKHLLKEVTVNISKGPTRMKYQLAFVY